MERAQSENLIDRLNDLSDVHQDELIAVKQVFIFCLLLNAGLIISCHRPKILEMSGKLKPVVVKVGEFHLFG